MSSYKAALGFVEYQIDMSIQLREPPLDYWYTIKKALEIAIANETHGIRHRPDLECCAVKNYNESFTG